MDRIIKDILSNFKGKKQVDKIVKLDDKYIISLSENGEPIVDEFYIYDNKGISPYIPTMEFIKSKNIVYDRRKRR